MAITKHYECDVCKELQDPRGLRWELQASEIYIKISGAWPQAEHKLGTVCPTCAEAINNAINEAIAKRAERPRGGSQSE